jgi:hypothetical protein
MTSTEPARKVCRGGRGGQLPFSRRKGSMYISIGAAILILILLIIFVF